MDKKKEERPPKISTFYRHFQNSVIMPIINSERRYLHLNRTMESSVVEMKMKNDITLHWNEFSIKERLFHNFATFRKYANVRKRLKLERKRERERKRNFSIFATFRKI